MKKLVIFLIVAGTANYLWHRYQRVQEDNWTPEVIANPVYAEARVQFDIQGRSSEGVMYIQTIDQADCQKQSRMAERFINEGQASICPTTCKLQQIECKNELAPRYAKLFDNKPTSVTYVSYARGNRSERELRLIYWGVTLDESDRLCSVIPDLQKGRKGLVTCVRAPRE